MKSRGISGVPKFPLMLLSQLLSGAREREKKKRERERKNRKSKRRRRSRPRQEGVRGP